jgi:hypothetical protein
MMEVGIVVALVLAVFVLERVLTTYQIRMLTRRVDRSLMPPPLARWRCVQCGEMNAGPDCRYCPLPPPRSDDTPRRRRV